MAQSTILHSDVTRVDAAHRGHDFIFFVTVTIITGRRVRGGIVGVEEKWQPFPRLKKLSRDLSSNRAAAGANKIKKVSMPTCVSHL
jgi:hypothetical protein